MKHSKLLPPLAALALSACISFGADPPASLLTLTSDVTIPADTGRSGSNENAITVVRPTVPQALATNRIPVQSSDTAVAYLKDAQWVEQPAELFRRLLSETIAVRTGRVVLDPRQFTFDPGTRLTGQLLSFGLDAQRMEVVAIYDAALSRSATTVETRRFEARIPVAAADVASVAPALNQAANRLATEVAEWIGS